MSLPIELLSNTIETGTSHFEGIARNFYFRLFYLYTRLRYGPCACNVMDEDFDNLIILDACRHDVFGEVTANKFNGAFDF